MNRRQEARSMALAGGTLQTCNQAPDEWRQHQGGAARQLWVLGLRISPCAHATMSCHVVNAKAAKPNRQCG